MGSKSFYAPWASVIRQAAMRRLEAGDEGGISLVQFRNISRCAFVFRGRSHL